MNVLLANRNDNQAIATTLKNTAYLPLGNTSNTKYRPGEMMQTAIELVLFPYSKITFNCFL
jgi:hypothetical protein